MSFPLDGSIPGQTAGDEFDDFSLQLDENLSDVAVSPPKANRHYRPLSVDEVKSTLSREILDAHGAIMAGTEISEDRRRSLKMFYGEPLGNEVEGRSQVVLTEVADTIHWIMPSLMRMFASGEDVFEFQAKRPEDEPFAKQATAFLNQVFWDEMDGFTVLYDWFFTALLEKNGFVTVYWDERYEPRIQNYEGLNAEQVESLEASEYGWEIVEYEEYEGPGGEPLYNVAVRQTKRVGRIKVRGIPPEEFLIARRITTLDDDTPFVGERVKMTASDLIAMGFDPDDVASWPTDSSPEFGQERTTRLAEEETFPLTTADRADTAGRELWVNNVFIRIDEDGDGYAELRHMMSIGDTSMELILDEHANHHSYAQLTASPVPHKFFGQSITDLVGDLQVIRSTLMRQMLDNLYITNNQQMKVIPGQVDMSDLLTSRPGNVIRVDSMDSMEPVVTPPLPPIAMGMMEYLDQIREVRVGVSRWTQGLDGGSLNGTATGVNAMMGASQARIELIGRIFASTGMKQLAKLLLREFKERDNKARQIRLDGEYVTVDPSMWNEDFGIKIKTGLGIGAAAEQIQFLMATIQLQKEALMSGGQNLVTPQDTFRALTELTKAMGFRGSDVFFTDPGDAPWPEPEPDTKLLENQRRTQDDQQKNEIARIEALTEAEEKRSLAEHRQKELDQQATLAREEMETRKEIARMQSRANDGEESERDGRDSEG